MRTCLYCRKQIQDGIACKNCWEVEYRIRGMPLSVVSTILQKALPSGRYNQLMRELPKELHDDVV